LRRFGEFARRSCEVTERTLGSTSPTTCFRSGGLYFWSSTRPPTCSQRRRGKSGEDRLRATLQHKAGELIAELARKGRSAGIHLLVAIQRPETTQLGDQGGSLRNNLTARLALGSLDADGLRMLGISPSDPVALTLDGTPGRGICVGFAGDPRPSACQVAWLDQERARVEVTPTYVQGLHLIQPSTTQLEDAAA
jgi:hypothetical protein